jgi:hypothetical protein
LERERLIRILAEFVVQHSQCLGVVPIHPHSEANRLFSLHGGKIQHALFAQDDERRKSVLFDIAFRLKPQVFFDIDFDPQTLAVETVLPALVESLHRAIALEQVLVHATPRVMNTHRIVRRDRTVNERPGRTARA